MHCNVVLDVNGYVNVVGPRQLDNEYKLKLNVRIAMLYLEDDDSVNAEMFIKKASSLVSACKVWPQMSCEEQGRKNMEGNRVATAGHGLLLATGMIACSHLSLLSMPGRVMAQATYLASCFAP